MNAPQPQFASFLLLPELQQVLQELGLSAPTPVQAESIPWLLQGKDLLGQSPTGSGKTLAFCLPLLQRLRKEERQLQALLLCPTRELCDQVAREVKKLGRRLPSLMVVSLVGGQPFFPQADLLRRGAEVAVGTPGRVLDHLRKGTIDLSQVNYFVLDEADRMLDMGFREELEALLAELPANRQSVFFSATLPKELEHLLSSLRNPKRVRVAGEASKPPVHQEAWAVADGEKTSALVSALAHFQPEQAIVFCNLKVTVAAVAEELASQGASVAALHGDLDQTDRDRVMAQFRNQSLRVLVATDVAARGIDVAGLDLVVNYDFPKPDIYVHRVGRTGRAGKSGLALTLLEAKEDFKLKRLREETGLSPERKEAPSTDQAALQEAPMATLYIGGGRKDKVRPGDILGALTGEAGGLEGKLVGRIEIHDRFSYVAVERSVAGNALARLRDGKIKGRKFRIEPVR